VFCFYLNWLIAQRIRLFILNC